MEKFTSIAVDYKSVDDWHVFSSRDLPGLYVASQDVEAAYNDVGNSIESLLRLNSGVSCMAVPEVPVSDFLRQAGTENSDPPRTISSRRYAVACA